MVCRNRNRGDIRVFSLKNAEIYIQKKQEAYDRLLEEYNYKCQHSFSYCLPPFKNGKLIYYGCESSSDSENATATDNFRANNMFKIGNMTNGTGTYSRWGESRMIYFDPISSFPNQKEKPLPTSESNPTWGIKIPLNNVTEMHKHIFIRMISHNDSNYEYFSAYLCNPATKEPSRWLGVISRTHRYTGYYSGTLDCFNVNGRAGFAHHEWCNLPVILKEEEIDSEDNIYIALYPCSGTSACYISGVAVADENVKSNIYMMGGCNINYGYLPRYGDEFANGAENNGQFNYNPRRYPSTSTPYYDFPYMNEYGKGIYITFFNTYGTVSLFCNDWRLKGYNDYLTDVELGLTRDTMEWIRCNCSEISNYPKFLHKQQHNINNCRNLSVYYIDNDTLERNSITVNGLKFFRWTFYSNNGINVDISNNIFTLLTIEDKM